MNWQGLETFSFGDNPALADQLLALVLEGEKRATYWTVSERLKGAAIGKTIVALGNVSMVNVFTYTYRANPGFTSTDTFVIQATGRSPDGNEAKAQGWPVSCFTKPTEKAYL